MASQQTNKIVSTKAVAYEPQKKHARSKMVMTSVDL